VCPNRKRGQTVQAPPRPVARDRAVRSQGHITEQTPMAADVADFIEVQAVNKPAEISSLHIDAGSGKRIGR